MALAACDPERAFAARVAARPGALEVGGRTLRTNAFDDVRVVALGKASDALVAAASRALDACGVAAASRRGLAIAHSAPARALPAWVERITGDHPTPAAASFEAGRRLLDFVSGCTERTLAIFLVSGGGSALAEWPLDERLGAGDLAALNDALVRADLSIREINAVRKRVSAIKGGRLAMRAKPATLVTLVVSDVAPGDVQSVASGPTVPDETSAAEAEAALDRVALAARPALVETPRAGDFAGMSSIVKVLVDCRDAARAAERAARDLAAEVVSLGCVDGPLDDVVGGHLAELERLLAARPGVICAVVSAGEATLEVAGSGLGGRNQHTVLRALVRAHDVTPSARELVALSVGTDGRDGPTDAAGAVAGLDALDRAAALGLDPHSFLERFDAYHFFDPLGALVRTGPTGTNIRDVRIFLGRR